MAMKFSKEDQEALKKSSAEIYQKRTDETNRQDIENLSTKGKIQQFIDYYLKNVIIAIIVVCVLITGIVQAVTRKPSNALYVVIVNDVLPEENIPAFKKALEKYYQLDTGKEIVTIDADSTDQKLQTYLYAGTIDVFITDETNYKQWAQAEYFMDAEHKKQTRFYKEYDKKYWYQTPYITGEDILNNKKTETKETKPGDKTPYTCGLYLTDSEKYKQLGGSVQKPVVGISATTKHITEAKQFVKYMMDNSQKMKLDVSKEKK